MKIETINNKTYVGLNSLANQLLADMVECEQLRNSIFVKNIKMLDDDLKAGRITKKEYNEKRPDIGGIDNNELCGKEHYISSVLENLGYKIVWINSGEWQTESYKTNAYLTLID